MAELIEGIVRQQLGTDLVDTVEVREDISFDGDEIYRIQVTYFKEDRLDAKSLVRLTSLLRQQLLNNGEERFPIFSFIAASELKGQKTGAA